jgi:PAS domain S-box-containing protein
MNVPARGAETRRYHHLTGGGEMGAAMRAHDWSVTPLGPPDTWPQPLKTLVDVMLGSNQPMLVAWGPERTLLYNDAYSEILAGKHPQALGRDFLDVWSEIRSDLVPIVERAYAGDPVQMDDIHLVIERRGYPEETHFAFSYTPVRDEAGAVAGFFCPCFETTEQVLADRRQAEERERQRRMFEQAPGFITILSSPEHRFEFANAAYRRLFGERGYIGKTVREAFPELADQNFFALLDQVYATGERFVAASTPIQFEGGSGELQDRFLDFIYEPVTDAAGRVTGIFVEGHDVTDAHRANAALRESEARYRMLFNSIESGFCVVEVDLGSTGERIDYRVVEANPAFYRHTGFSENIANKWLRVAAPALEEHWYETYARVASTGVPERFEESSEHLGRWFDVFAFPTGAPDERRVGILFTDISARRTAEEQLRASEARLRAVVNAAPVGLVFADASGRITGANAGIEAILGRPVTSSPGVDRYGADYVAFHADGRRVESDEYPLAQVLRGDGDRAELEVQVQLPDKSLRWVRYIATPMKDEEGQALGAVVASLDIDQEKRFAENLAREVKRALAELEQAQQALRQSQKMEAMGQLTGGVAHDFNNLLTPIIGSLDMLQRRSTSSERERRLIDGALQSAEKAKTLVQRLLAFARRQPLQPQAVDVPRLVGGMADLVASTSGPHVKVVVNLSPDVPFARADPNQLEMAILNLAVNARDAMPDGGILTFAVEVDEIGGRHRSNLPQGRYVRLSVADTGTGMDDTTLARAVEPFFSTKGIGRGTGLGLSMVDGLAGQLGGALAIASKPGLGTIIELWLPATEGTETRSDEPASARHAAVAGTVLLVDDEDLVRASTAEMLSDLGYGVVETASGEEALQLVNTGLKFDLLVTDHLMPGMKGTDLARALLKMFPERPALVVSGYAEVDGIAPDLPRLSKPFRQVELAGALAELRAPAAAPGARS